MTDLQWFDYVGSITGVIGAVTGITGAILGYLGYRKSSEIKALDLRIELKRAIVDIQHGIAELDRLMPYADQSRHRAAAASGARGSGAMRIWEAEFEQDRLQVEELRSDAPPQDKDYSGNHTSELEEKLIRVHDLQKSVDALLQKYTAAIAADDATRSQIRATMEGMTNQ